MIDWPLPSSTSPKSMVLKIDWERYSNTKSPTLCLYKTPSELFQERFLWLKSAIPIPPDQFHHKVPPPPYIPTNFTVNFLDLYDFLFCEWRQKAHVGRKRDFFYLYTQLLKAELCLLNFLSDFRARPSSVANKFGLRGLGGLLSSSIEPSNIRNEKRKAG